MHTSPTETMVIEAGHKRLSAAELETLLLGNTTRGLYRGGFRFISYIHDNHTMEGVNHVGSHNVGTCSFDVDEGTMTVTWQNGWEHTTTRAYRTDDGIRFFDADTGRWRQTFSEILPGRQPLLVT